MSFTRLETADLNGKTALVRVDFNVPRNEDGTISDDTRIRAAVPTIQHLQENGAKIVLLSHFGRPKGQPNPDMSLGFIVPALEKIVGKSVTFIERPSAEGIAELDQDAIVLIENTRFSSMETEGDPKMAQFLATLGDIFVMDAFSASHRNHVSSAVIGEYLPAYAGLAMERELDHLAAALDHPKTPVMAIVGGAKVSTKIDVAPHEMILDAGPETVAAILDAMEGSKTLIWNGPLGAFELTPFDTSTVECAKYAAKLCRGDKIIKSSPSQAGAIQSPLSPSQMCWMTSPLFLPLAGLSWNGWKAKPYPVSKFLNLTPSPT